MASLGNWVYSSDFTATGTNTDTQVSEGSLTIYGDGLKVGDAAQTTLSAGLVLTPMKDLRISETFIMQIIYMLDTVLMIHSSKLQMEKL